MGEEEQGKKEEERKPFDKFCDQIKSRVSLETLPPGYDIDTALMAAWQAIRTKPVTVYDHGERINMTLKEATRPHSWWDAMTEMVLWGLDPLKDQCYFIPRGQYPNMTLNMQMGKFGTKAVLLRHPGIRDIVAYAVFEGDKVDYEGDGESLRIKSHKQRVENREPPEGEGNRNMALLRHITGAYATIMWEDGRTVTAVYSKREIYEAWAKGQPNNKGDDPDQAEKFLTNYQSDYPISAVERTALNKLGGEYKNTLPDLPAASVRGSIDVAEAAADDDMDDEASTVMEKPAKGFPEDDDEDEEAGTATEPEAEPQPEPTPSAKSQADGDEVPPEPEDADQSPPQEDESQQEEPSFWK